MISASDNLKYFLKERHQKGPEVHYLVSFSSDKKTIEPKAMHEESI